MDLNDLDWALRNARAHYKYLQQKAARASPRNEKAAEQRVLEYGEYLTYLEQTVAEALGAAITEYRKEKAAHG